MTALIAALLLVPAWPAAADDTPPSDAPPETGLTAPATGDDAARAPLNTSPNGCYGQTDNPHRSGSESSVHGRTRCSFAVSVIGVDVVLWHNAWFGWNALNTGSSEYPNRNNSGDGTPHYGCSATTTQSFMGTSYHYTVEGGTTYTAQTSNAADFVC